MVWRGVGQLEDGLCAGGSERCGGRSRLGPDLSGCHAIVVVKPRVPDQPLPLWQSVGPLHILRECVSSEFKGSLFRQMAQVRQKEFLKLRDIQKAQEDMRVSELQKV